MTERIPRHAGELLGPERAIRGVRPNDRHVGNPFTQLKAAHAIAELVNLSDEVVTHYERWAPQAGLRIEMLPYQGVGVLHAGGEHADPHLASAGQRHRNIDHFELVRTPEAP